MIALGLLAGCDGGPTEPIDSGMMRTDTGPDLGACDDGLRNGDETDIDCGGTCDPCSAGLGCAVDIDCADGVCGIRLTCLEPSCIDNTRNGSETDRDCGGPDCPACRDTRMCAMDSDCDSIRCEGGICVRPQCEDGVVSGDESDVDCGGTMCPPCEGGDACDAGDDCTSTVCDMGTCTVPRCDDTIFNGAETDTDCGGPACAPCGADQMCSVGSDCASLVCSPGLICLAPTCMDGVRNGDEIDIDCAGAASMCPLCPPGAMCTSGATCDSAVCDMGACTTAACDDSIRNGGESDVDCGGMTACPRCPDLSGCTDPSDCTTSECTLGFCGPIAEITIAALASAQTGSLGGLAGADAMCQAEALANGFMGTWIALLAAEGLTGGPARSYDTIFTGPTAMMVPVRNVMGADLATSWNALMSAASGAMTNDIYTFTGVEIEEGRGTPVDWSDADGWTGANAMGVTATGLTCSDWTTTTGSGRNTELDARQLLRLETHACTATLAVACVRTGG